MGDLEVLLDRVQVNPGDTNHLYPRQERHFLATYKLWACGLIRHFQKTFHVLHLFENSQKYAIRILATKGAIAK